MAKSIQRAPGMEEQHHGQVPVLVAAWMGALKELG